jgi:CBS-domain-containing membrane protein
MTAADLMSHTVVMVPQEMSLQGAARLLSQAQVSGAPVVDNEGCCVGVLSATDFLHVAEKGKNAVVTSEPKRENICSWQIVESAEEGEKLVKNFMTPDSVMVLPGTNIGEISQMMLDAHIHRVIVTNEDQKPLGIVSSMDVLAALAREYSVHRSGIQTASPDATKDPPALVDTEYVGRG